MPGVRNHEGLSCSSTAAWQQSSFKRWLHRSRLARLLPRALLSTHCLNPASPPPLRHSAAGITPPLRPLPPRPAAFQPAGFRLPRPSQAELGLRPPPHPQPLLLLPAAPGWVAARPPGQTGPSAWAAAAPAAAAAGPSWRTTRAAPGPGGPACYSRRWSQSRPPPRWPRALPG